MAKFLGDTTAKYRWFAIIYMLLMFVALPALFMSLSFAGPPYVIAAAAIICGVGLFVVLVNFMRNKCPSYLPGFLMSWKWLPVWFRSLEPYDRVFSKFSCCRKLKEKSQTHGGSEDPADNQVEKVVMSDLAVNSEANRGNVNPAFVE